MCDAEETFQKFSIPFIQSRLFYTVPIKRRNSYVCVYLHYIIALKWFCFEITVYEFYQVTLSVQNIFIFEEVGLRSLFK